MSAEKLEIQQIPLPQIELDADQPRKKVGDLEGLANSIKERGVLHPILVERLGDNKYRLISGERRYRACERIHERNIPAIVYPVTSEADRISIQLIENIQRKQLHPIEEAQAILTFKNQSGKTSKQIAPLFALSEPALSNRLRVLDLPKEIIKAARSSENVTHSLLLEIAKVGDPEKQVRLWEEFRDRMGGLSVRDVKKRGRYGKRYAEFSKDSVGLRIAVRWKTRGNFLDEKRALEMARDVIEQRLRTLGK
jgi:ParB family chromosome partitioning protein